MPNVYDTLKARGFIAQCTHEEELRDLLGRESVTFYRGYDPTANSLTTGHLLTIMMHTHMQQAGHRLITLMGTGTGMIGDPTDRNDMRRVMPPEEVAHNIECFKKQFAHFAGEVNAETIVEDNGWLLDLNLVSFMRDYGVHFNVNKMLAAECYKSRLADGLTAFEMTYMLMQAYDFLELYRRHNCLLQLGGSEQWGNIIAGIDLVRKIEGKQVYGLTNVLLTAADGGKMGKSMGNAVWLSAEKTSPYDFYQHWRNTGDAVVIRDLKLFTFLDLDEIEEMARWQGAELNKAKEILALEVTKIVHGQEEAQKAQDAAKTLFASGRGASAVGSAPNGANAMPQTDIPRGEADAGINIVVLLEKMGLIESRGEARRLIQQNGIKMNDKKIETHEQIITAEDFDKDGYLLIQKGKKIFHRGRLV
ncbi:MAG: tyrosine--tRNA ligase [Defluviitaleaceae bacterium]|nr:tyrosine--tRNA ligase [Defluviitaleaceae bacterium]MCL2275635.1 tyrosine--tRNA ligase [Defluviitaleaceae bacterium]